MCLVEKNIIKSKDPDSRKKRKKPDSRGKENWLKWKRTQVRYRYLSQVEKDISQVEKEMSQEEKNPIHEEKNPSQVEKYRYLS